MVVGGGAWACLCECGGAAAGILAKLPFCSPREYACTIAPNPSSTLPLHWPPSTRNVLPLATVHAKLVFVAPVQALYTWPRAVAWTSQLVEPSTERY